MLLLGHPGDHAFASDHHAAVPIVHSVLVMLHAAASAPLPSAATSGMLPDAAPAPMSILLGTWIPMKSGRLEQRRLEQTTLTLALSNDDSEQ